MDSSTPKNSQAYWDDRFAGDWEQFDGPNQSVFFSKVALSHLPQWLLATLKQDKLTLVDWGCAQGDGTAVLEEYVTEGYLTGVDFSTTAIEQAIRRYPSIRFLAQDWCSDAQENSESFDVLFSSNTLEHFHDPYQVLARLTQFAHKAIILAIPYREQELIDEHFVRFFADTIPLKLNNDFNLVWSKVVNCQPMEHTQWPGEQIVLVYAKRSWFEHFTLNLNDGCIEINPDQQSEIDYYQEQITVLNQQLMGTNSQLAAAHAELKSRAEHIKKLDQDMITYAQHTEFLNKELATRAEHNRKLDQQLLDQLEAFSHLKQSYEKIEQDYQILDSDFDRLEQDHKVLERKMNTLDHEYSQLVLKRDHLQLELTTIEQKNAGLIQENSDLTQLLQLLQNSISWRLTRPLRVLKRWLTQGVSSQDKKHLHQLLLRLYYKLPHPIASTGRTLYRRFVKAWFIAENKLTAQNHEDNPFTGSESQRKSSIIGPKKRQDGPDYIIWGVIDWHFRHQRPQQLAKALAQSGRRVFYISSELLDNDQAGFSVEALGQTNDLFQIKLQVKNAPVIYEQSASDAVYNHLRASLAQVIQWANFGPIVNIINHPFWYQVARVLPNQRLIYDCMDHHEGFGNTGAALIALEKQLLSNADLTIVTSEWLEKSVAKKVKQKVLIRNGAEYEYFSTVPKAFFQDETGRKIIGYYGAIAQWFDIELIAKIAHRFHDCLILMIGADTVDAQKQLAHYTNIKWVGEVPYHKLCYYLYGFDVCLLPFKIIPLTLATNPVKVYEYLSAGKPVVAVDLPEMVQFNDLVDVAKDHEQFLVHVAKHLNQALSTSELNQVQSFAAKQSWHHRAQALMDAVEHTVMEPSVSVIVLTYNNLALTKACLSSIEQHSEYNNLEIIVVDNASSDGSAEYLEHWKNQQHSMTGVKKHLILNDQNKGFAAGNNQGLTVASGDYLVILNNDTYVTPGWVRSLLAHFVRDPNIGIIGPVTNNIGNEAKLNIHYNTMDEMMVQAKKYTVQHLGENIIIRTVAFFCVMFPRSTYKQVGLLDERFGRGFFEDDDYCRRVEQCGLKVVCAEDVFVHHHLSASFNQLKQTERQQLFDTNRKLYEEKWGPWSPHEYIER